jgi:hypothetical protein
MASDLNFHEEFILSVVVWSESMKNLSRLSPPIPILSPAPCVVSCRARQALHPKIEQKSWQDDLSQVNSPVVGCVRIVPRISSFLSPPG